MLRHRLNWGGDEAPPSRTETPFAFALAALPVTKPLLDVGRAF